MTTWNYKLERFDLMASGGYTNVENNLTNLGRQGWELVGVEMVGEFPYAVLKRPGTD